MKASKGTAHLAGPRLAGRRARPPAPHRRRGRRRSPRPGVPVAIHAFLDGRDVPPKSAARPDRRARGGAARRRPHRHGLAAASTPWTATSAGSGSAAAVAAILHAEGEHAGDRRRGDRGRLRPRRDRRVRDADGDRRLHAAPPTATASSSPTSAPTGPGRSSARWSTRSSTASRSVGRPKWAALLGMVQYSDRLDTLMPAMFPSGDIVNTLGAWVAGQGAEAVPHRRDREVPPRHLLPQRRRRGAGRRARSATWRRARRSAPTTCSRRCRRPRSPSISSPRSARATTRLIVVNFANPDMVGHTGILEAAIKAVEAVDRGPRRGAGGGRGRRAAPSSSPPTTATAR